MSNQCQHGQLARVCELCEKDAEIATLRQYLDAAQRRGEELRAQVAALEVDAGRYRWLRENQHPQVMHPSCYGMGNAMREHLDTAIDAALAARKGAA